MRRGTTLQSAWRILLFLRGVHFCRQRTRGCGEAQDHIRKSHQNRRTEQVNMVENKKAHQISVACGAFGGEEEGSTSSTKNLIKVDWDDVLPWILEERWDIYKQRNAKSKPIHSTKKERRLILSNIDELSFTYQLL